MNAEQAYEVGFVSAKEQLKEIEVVAKLTLNKTATNPVHCITA